MKKHFVILHNIVRTSISMNLPVKSFINKGVTKGAIKIAIAVIVIDNAILHTDILPCTLT